MSEQAKPGIYVYQPCGMQDKAQWASGRIYGVGGLPMDTTCEGFTKPEAEAIVDALRRLGEARADRLDAEDIVKTEPLPNEQIRLLAHAVVNCHVLARRALHRSTSAYDRKKWEHVRRLCEEAGARSPGVLRMSLPTELTDGETGERPVTGTCATCQHHLLKFTCAAGVMRPDDPGSESGREFHCSLYSAAPTSAADTKESR